MKFSTPTASGSHFKLARMAQKDNKSSTAEKSTSWKTLQLLSFAFFGALVAASLSLRHQHNQVTSTGIPTQDTIQMILGSSKVKILSLDPFIAHITDFVSKKEREHLIDLG